MDSLVVNKCLNLYETTRMLSKNLQYLRQQIRYGKDELGEKLGLSRGQYAAYEKGSEPRLALLTKILAFYKKRNPEITLDHLVSSDLEAMNIVLDNIKEDEFHNEQLSKLVERAAIKLIKEYLNSKDFNLKDIMEAESN